MNGSFPSCTWERQIFSKLSFDMRSRYKIVEPEAPHFLTCTIVGWMPVLTRQKYLDIITASLTFCRQQKGLRLHAYVILDNHLHLLVSAENLSEVIRDFKRHTAKEILAAARQDDKLWLLKQLEYFKGGHKKESQHQVWQEGVHPQAITSEEMLRQKLDYIHHNPVRTGLVDCPEDWRYSSARNYLGREGVLKIDLVEL
jgi:REP element-mobilizing transposase RayT